MSDLVIRDRRAEDVPRLCEVLAEQQAGSDYPMRWPLPFPIEDFVVRPYQRRAWVGEVEGVVLGHVSAGDVTDEAWAEVYRSASGTSHLGVLSTLFTGTAARGTGLGGLLYDTAVAWIRDQGMTPVLDVVPVHELAIAMYVRRGWREVARVRTDWLPPDRPDIRLMVLDGNG